MNMIALITNSDEYWTAYQLWKSYKQTGRVGQFRVEKCSLKRILGPVGSDQFGAYEFEITGMKFEPIERPFWDEKKPSLFERFKKCLKF